MSINQDIAVSNLTILKTFVIGDKPTYNKQTGEITKEDRAVLVGMRRWLFGAFNTACLTNTFQTTLPFLKNNEDIFRDFFPALEGIKNIANTYIKEGKKETAKKVQTIYNFFKREYNGAANIPAPPSAPVSWNFFERKKITSASVNTVSTIAKFDAELKKRITMPLRKAERSKPAVLEREESGLFNMSMLKKVPQKEDNDVWENEGEWAIEKAPLLRTQSEYIPRYAQPVLEVIKTSAKPLKQKDIVFDKSEFQFLASKLKERRKVLI